MRKVVTTLLTELLRSCAGLALLFVATEVAAETKVVLGKTYGDRWPFRAEQLVLGCLSDYSVYLEHETKRYALNGSAEARGYPRPGKSIFRIDQAALAHAEQTIVRWKSELGESTTASFQQACNMGLQPGLKDSSGRYVPYHCPANYKLGDQRLLKELMIQGVGLCE